MVANTTRDARVVWDDYTAAWAATGAEAKRAALAASTHPECEYRDPLAHTKGREALVEYMLDLHRQLPGGYFETTYFLAHHGRSIARWNMRDGAHQVVGEGISYGEYDGAGTLVAMSGFYATPAA